MKNSATIQTQFNQLKDYESNLFEAIRHRQNQLEAELRHHANRQDSKLDRQSRIQKKSNYERIANPANNRISLFLGNCIQDLQHLNLEDVRARQETRQKEREAINQMRRSEELAKVLDLGVEEKVAGEASKNQKKKQIPWKLMRKLREKDVEENRKRIEKKLLDKISKIGNKFH